MGRLRSTLILGGPGCGKTTALLKIVEQAFSRGVEPERIAFVAFTRKAAQEARERMSEKFGIEPDQIPYFRTLHSFAFSFIDAQRSQILDEDKLREYAKAEGLQLSASFIDDFNQAELTPHTPDEQALAAAALSRLMCVPFDDLVVKYDLDHGHATKVVADYEEFKEDASLLDFTDMIEQFDGADLPSFDLLIVDEAQDLSRLQWRMVERMIEHSKDVYFAGDDDQAIYEWAGADVPYFLTLDADREVLPVSYRLKRNIFDACQKMIAHCDHRYEKGWQPHADGGEVDHVASLHDLDFSEGTWFLLARTNTLVQAFTKHMRDQGWAYISPTVEGMKPSTSAPAVQAVLVFENLKRGRTFKADQVQNMWKHVRPKLRPEAMPAFQLDQDYGIDDVAATGLSFDMNWMEALAMSSPMQAYIRAMRARGESLIKKPRITVSTFHGVKGGEADNVVIWQKLTSRTYQRWIEHDDQEVRAMFTAMSRAKERLIFLDAPTRISYGIERFLL
ncbi:DNA helicase [Dinoroseobacter phage vB_DshS-R5C]|uniref:ATP-dependent DNA helicase n=1 Tax=Dinoroseobacter phage vB_DshS-R5C TaxID=1965368 RepID=A0A1V0DYA4_9CAUD|nr:DNA helicase [Dinoroseobacter phage vB_DshS-R5C]ARB06131.1 ATP-dependent DNA helicase [Dinoroseobacter phage vB_DshS-R5C]